MGIITDCGTVIKVRIIKLLFIYIYKPNKTSSFVKATIFSRNRKSRTDF